MTSKKSILIKPLLTEKMVGYKETENKYAFVVERSANKIEIKRAVEERFKVRVSAVNTMNYSGKLKRQGRFEGRRAAWKKAIVSLQKGDEIEIVEGL
ncbi:MAG: 50S ribosomal protein L23 [Candidatus Delongbacteria bacterium]|nr:50S ribosomal protein L23 [Candidatus Delongbacteria bacterium]